jgi:hypothetical protein
MFLSRLNESIRHDVEVTRRRSSLVGSQTPRRQAVYTKILIAAALGAGYGLWGLEAASPLAIPLILWAIAVLLLVWRMNPTLSLFVACSAAFAIGFGAVWTIVLGRLLATCKPPACQTTDPATDVLYAAAILTPVLLAGAAVIAIRHLGLRRG